YDPAGSSLSLPFEVRLTPVGGSFDLRNGTNDLTTSTTPVGALNGGIGVRTVPGQNDFEVTLSNGTSFNVNLDHDPTLTPILATDGTGLLPTSATNTTSGAADLTVSLSDGLTTFNVDLNATPTPVHLSSTVTITDGGSGYSSTDLPDVTITTALNDHGSGATATAVVSTLGVVTGITLTNLGSGYTVAPTITIAPPVGSGTQATATVALGTPALDSVVALLNAAASTAGAGSKFQARVDAARGSLLLIDLSGGNGTFTVSSASGSTAATSLGLGTASTKTIDGAPQLVIESSFFTVGDLMAKIRTSAGSHNDA